MTRNQKLHRELWFWLAKNPDKEKRDWKRWEHITGNALFYECFACVTARKPTVCSGESCPINWETRYGNYCCSYDSIYILWKKEKNLEKRSIMAEVIACKEWKEK